MKIKPIFDTRLYSVQFKDDWPDEFEKIFDDWQDPFVLDKFFNDNEADLKGGFFGSISIEQAITQTRQEAVRLENTFRNLAISPHLTLDTIFKPLENTIDSSVFERNKAKGDWHKSWLRVYAIKIDTGVFCVTGGAIKLTRTMGERTHTNRELIKIRKCLAYFKEQGVTDDLGFFELLKE